MRPAAADGRDLGIHPVDHDADGPSSEGQEGSEHPASRPQKSWRWVKASETERRAGPGVSEWPGDRRCTVELDDDAPY